MMHRHAFEALDRSLRDIMSDVDPSFNDIPFGNKIIIFGGDFRQILPVVKRGTRGDIVNAAFNRSNIWSKIIKLKLSINMRIQTLSGSDQDRAKDFAEFLMRIGNGSEPTYRDSNSGFEDLIRLPNSLASTMSMTDLINYTYPNLSQL